MRRFLSTEFTVGTFALLGLLIIIYMSLKVNDRDVTGGATDTYHAYFDSVSGLVQKVPVEVAGITSGYVDSISLDNNRAKVTISVNRKVKVYADASVTIRDRGILGDRFVQLNPGDPKKPALNDGDQIPNAFSQSDIQRMAQSLADTGDMIQQLVKSDNPSGALGQVIVNLRDTTEKVKTLVGDNEGRIGRILENMENLSTDLSDITRSNKDEIHTVLVTLEEVAQSLNKAMGPFDETMASINRIVAKVERGEGTVGKLINDETTVNNINEAAEGLNEALGAYRKVRLSLRYRGEFLFSAAEVQHLVGITLAPGPDKFILFEIIDSPQGKTRVVNTTVSSNGTPVSQTEVIQTSDDIVFSLLIAKRFWDVTFKFGLMRSQGGAGFDYSLFKDKLIVSFEAFDFGRPNNRAHMRAYGTLVLYKHLLLTGGVDDLITKVGGRNPFFGMGIQFTDDDWKSLATSMAGKVL